MPWKRCGFLRVLLPSSVEVGDNSCHLATWINFCFGFVLIGPPQHSKNLPWKHEKLYVYNIIIVNYISTGYFWQEYQKLSLSKYLLPMPIKYLFSITFKIPFCLRDKNFHDEENHNQNFILTKYILYVYVHSNNEANRKKRLCTIKSFWISQCFIT